MTTSIAPVPVPTTSTSVKAAAGRQRLWAWVFYTAAALYFLLPLGATFYWSLRAEKDTLGFEAYRRLFADMNFLPAFSQSIGNAIAAILLSLLLGIVNSCDVPIRQSFVVEMIEAKEDLANAIALNSSMFHGTRLIGPSLAGQGGVSWPEFRSRRRRRPPGSWSTV